MSDSSSIKIADIPVIESAKEMKVFGITDKCLPFSKSQDYEPGDIVRNDGNYYRFKVHHDSGNAMSEPEVDLVTVDIKNVQADLSFVSDGLQKIESLTQKSGYAFSGDNLGRFIDFTIYVKSSDSSFQISDRIVKAVSDSGCTLTAKTDSEGKCVLSLDKLATWTIETEEIDGWKSETITGRRYTATPLNMNVKSDEAEEFNLTWSTNNGYHIGEIVTYNGERYTFTAEHKGAWTGTDVSKTAYLKNEMTFTYYPVRDSEKVTLTMKMEYENGIPISANTMMAFAGDENAFTFDTSLLSGDIVGWSSSTGDANGELSIELPKNQYCELFFPTLNCHNDPSIISQTTITDTDKTIKSIYDSGIRWVCGSTSTSKSDGTAWREYRIDEFPFESDGSYDPEKHPCVLVHVATDQLKNVKFDHTHDELLKATGYTSTSNDQEFYHNERAYDASYYIRIEDLTSKRSAEVTKGRQWCTQNLLHPHVTTSTDTTVLSSFDGPWMTSMMKYDSENLLSSTTGYVAATSPAADYALSSTFEFGEEGEANHRILHGFIGTYTQMNPLFVLSLPIYEGLKKFGYSPNYKTGTYWWSATQYNKTNIYQLNGNNIKTYGMRPLLFII